MDKNRVQYYRNRLIQERNRIRNTLDAMLNNGLRDSQSVETQELSLYDNHPGDAATEVFDKGRRYALVDNEKYILNRIDDSLNRIEDGTYGKCELCGNEIPEERLDFLPYVTTCIECEEKKPDYNTYRYDRPVEEEVLNPYGTYFMDVSGDLEDEIEYDGEDAWQDVSKYNEYTGRTELYYDDEFDPEADGGYVEFTDSISNQQYKDQLP